MTRTRVILLCALIAGCASITDQPTGLKSSETLWQLQRQSNTAVSSWTLKGKIGVKSGNKGGSATLIWTYLSDHQDIELYGPFGGGRIQITATENFAILKDTKGLIIEGDSAEQVLYRRLGWKVPFNELIMWARGLPNEDASNIQIDDFGQLKSLDKGIWHVEYQEYRRVESLNLPRKFTITSIPGKLEITDDDGNYIGDTLSIKVILKRWRNLGTS